MDQCRELMVGVFNFDSNIRFFRCFIRAFHVEEEKRIGNNKEPELEDEDDRWKKLPSLVS